MLSVLLMGVVSIALLGIGGGAGYLIARWKYQKLLATAQQNPASSQASAEALIGLVSRVNDQAAQHSNRVDEIQERLQNASAATTSGSDSVAAAASELREANKQLQAGLTAASREIEAHAERLQPPAAARRTDGVTLMLNREAFDAELAAVLNQRPAGASGGMLVAIGVDRFEQIKDRFGAAVCDKALQQVARSLRNALLGIDAETSRFGNEELAAYLSATSIQTATTFARELLSSVEKRGVKHESENVAVTISVGLAEATAGLKMDELVTRAQQAMQAAKSAGGNRCFVHNGRECAPIDAQLSVGAAVPLTTTTSAPSATRKPEPASETSPAAASPPVASVPSKGPDQRAHRRQKFGGMHCIAPYLNERVPTPDMFYAARFADISSGGFSMLLPEPPECRSFVVALSKGNGTIYVTAEVVRTRESVESDGRFFIVGCRFTGRIEIDCMTREVQYA